MSRSEPLAAVVLAGGRGTRMGGADKGLVEYRRRPLIEWVLDAIRPQVKETFISANRNLDVYGRYGCRVLPDAIPDFPGPLAGVLAAMDETAAGWLLVVPCDTPQLPADLARRLYDAAMSAHVPLAVAADEARVHHTIMLVRTDRKADLERYLLQGGHAVYRWQEGMGSCRVPFPAASLANLNRLEDLSESVIPVCIRNRNNP